MTEKYSEGACRRNTRDVCVFTLRSSTLHAHTHSPLSLSLSLSLPPLVSLSLPSSLTSQEGLQRRDGAPTLVLARVTGANPAPDLQQRLEQLHPIPWGRH